MPVRRRRRLHGPMMASAQNDLDRPQILAQPNSQQRLNPALTGRAESAG
jgi:hypothetical protein